MEQREEPRAQDARSLCARGACGASAISILPLDNDRADVALNICGLEDEDLYGRSDGKAHSCGWAPWSVAGGLPWKGASTNSGDDVTENTEPDESPDSEREDFAKENHMLQTSDSESVGSDSPCKAWVEGGHLYTGFFQEEGEKCDEGSPQTGNMPGCTYEKEDWDAEMLALEDHPYDQAALDEVFCFKPLVVSANPWADEMPFIPSVCRTPCMGWRCVSNAAVEGQFEDAEP